MPATIGFPALAAASWEWSGRGFLSRAWPAPTGALEQTEYES